MFAVTCFQHFAKGLFFFITIGLSWLAYARPTSIAIDQDVLQALSGEPEKN